MEGTTNSYTIILTITLLFLFLIRTIFSKTRPKAHLPPGPLALPIIGHLHLIRSPIHRSFNKFTHQYGPLIHLRLGSKLFIIASSPDTIKEVLKTHEIAFSNRPETIASRRLAYNSAGFAFAPYGPYWKFIKKLCMSELLGGRTVELLQPIRRKELMAMLGTLMSKARAHESVNVTWEMIKMMNNVITRMMASKASEGRGGEGEEARKLVKEVAELVGVFNLADFFGFLRNFDVQGLGRRIEEAHAGFDKMMERIIKEKEEVRRRRKEVGKGEGEGENEVRDLLDVFLDIYEDENSEMKITRDNIKGFFQEIFTAGTDTTATTVDWALAELINHPDMLKKASEELDMVIGKDRIVEESDISNLPYLQAIIKETLRLHPTVPLATRVSTKDTKVCGYDIPANTNLFISIWSVGRDPNYWSNPLEFQPDRFMSQDKTGLDSIDVRGQYFHLLPFGSGRRSCPGTSLSLQLIHVTLGAMLQCFEWKVSGEKGMVDMSEGNGLVISRAHPLICVPVARVDKAIDLN